MESLYKIQIEKSKELKYEQQVYAQETTFGDSKYDYCRLKLVVQRHLEQKMQDFHVKTRNRDEDRPAVGAPHNGKAKGQGKYNVKKSTRDQTAYVGLQKAHVCMKIRADSIMNQTRKAKDRDDLVHLLRQDHRTENSKGGGKGGDDGMR